MKAIQRQFAPSACVVAIGLSLLPLAIAASAQQPGPAPIDSASRDAQSTIPALLYAAPTPDGAVALPQTTSFVAASIDLTLLGTCRPNSRFTLDVAPGHTLTAVVRKLERRSDNSYSVFGALEGLDDSSFIIAVQDDAAAADIICPPQGLHYRFKYVGDGVHLVCAVDDAAYAPCGGARQAPAIPDEDFFPEADDGLDPPPGGSERGACTDVETVFDAMVVYTNLARMAAGGTSAIQAEVHLAVDRTNEAYGNSPISARYRLVWMTEVTYDEVGDYADHLDRLRNSNDNPWVPVRQYRDSQNADFCTLWVDDGEYCGLAYCTSDNGSAYSVVTWSCAAASLSHAHEVGHNQGCAHDPDNDGGGCAAYSYSFGHRYVGSDSNEYRTVMAYAPGTRVPYFSNPNVTYQGTATGTESRNNALTINDRRATCADFQVTRYDIWLDFAFDGSESGTFSNPYDTVTEGLANIDPPGFNVWELPNLYIKSGITNWTGTISQGMRVQPCGGMVQIGS